MAFLNINTAFGPATVAIPGGFSNVYKKVIIPVVTPSGCTFLWKYDIGGSFIGHEITNDTFFHAHYTNYSAQNFSVYVNSFDGALYLLDGWIDDATPVVRFQLTVTAPSGLATTLATDGSDLIVQAVIHEVN